MQLSDICLAPTKRTLRQFAALWLVFFSGLALWQVFVRSEQILAAFLALVALVIGPLGLLKPAAMRPIFVTWMVLVFPIGWLVSQILLAMVFYGLFAPLGLLFRATGRDPLTRAFDVNAATYWVPKKSPSDLRSYFRQF